MALHPAEGESAVNSVSRQPVVAKGGHRTPGGSGTNAIADRAALAGYGSRRGRDEPWLLHALKQTCLRRDRTGEHVFWLVEGAAWDRPRQRHHAVLRTSPRESRTFCSTPRAFP